jgi:S1-C subfamily serine protease
MARALGIEIKTSIKSGPTRAIALLALLRLSVSAALMLVGAASAFADEPGAANSNSNSNTKKEVFLNDLRPPVLSNDEIVNITVYKNANRGVVNIAPLVSAEDYMVNHTAEGCGSGVIISTDGNILTNYHVVDNAEHVRVTLWDGSSFHGKVVGIDKQTDLAVINIKPPATTQLTVIPLGDSSQLEVGRRVFSIGNPFALDRTMTVGIVSSLGRTIPVAKGRLIKGVIQTDAAINPGNSGGPLLDSLGRVVGITTAIYSTTGGSSGVGFAIPVNIAKSVIPQILDHHRVLRPELGVEVTPAGEVGLRVLTVAKGSPADLAGLSGAKIVIYDIGGGIALQRPDLTVADIILEADGIPTNTVDGLMSYIESMKPNQAVTLTVIRNGRAVKIPVKLIGNVSD